MAGAQSERITAEHRSKGVSRQRCRSTQHRAPKAPSGIDANHAAHGAGDERRHNPVVLSQGPADVATGVYADKDAEFHGYKMSIIDAVGAVPFR
jgi:hypothetical protein